MYLYRAHKDQSQVLTHSTQEVKARLILVAETREQERADGREGRRGEKEVGGGGKRGSIQTTT
jgi:hypothetical protein